jgi:hypothetical protein
MIDAGLAPIAVCWRTQASLQHLPGVMRKATSYRVEASARWEGKKALKATLTFGLLLWIACGSSDRRYWHNDRIPSIGTDGTMPIPKSQ